MATQQLIDLSNYDSLLVQSAQGRSGSPDGNIFFDTTNGRIELITAEELANVDLGEGSTANPLANVYGIKMEALYAFENQERRTDEALRQYDRYFRGTFKFGGAYELVNSRKLDDADGSGTSTTTDDRFKVRGSGWIERSATGGIGRIYYGVKSLGTIENPSQPYYQLSATAAPEDFSKTGPIDEAVQVYGNIAVDPNTTTFDTRTYLSNKIRTFGYNYDEKKLVDSGVSEMGGYASGFAIGESVHLTTGEYDLADVYGTGAISPWDVMGLEELDTPTSVGGFNETAGNFTWIVNNDSDGTLDECVAFLDALAQTDDDINDHGSNVTNGKRVATWYTYDAQGRIVTRSGADSMGMYIFNIPTSDQQRVVFTDDDGYTKTYPFQVEVQADVGSVAVSDSLAWYHSFFLDDYGTTAAITVVDANSAEVKGNVQSDASGNNIIFPFDYDGDATGGTAGTNKDCVFVCEGDGGAAQAKTLYTISRQTTVSFSCAPAQESNV